MRTYSMISHNRRKHQRWFNRYCRHVNKSIENDNLWLGRFYISQDRTHMEWFDDGSGGLMYAIEKLVKPNLNGMMAFLWNGSSGGILIILLLKIVKSGKKFLIFVRIE